MRYEVTVKIRRIVVDTVDLILDADSNDEAFDKIEGVLNEYPEGHDVPDVHYCLTRDRWQEDAEILDANLTTEV